MLQKEIAATFFAERSRFVLWVPVLFGLGVGIYFGLHREPPLWLALLLPFAALGLMFLPRRFLPLRLLGAAGFVITLGFSGALASSRMVEAPVLRKNLYYRELSGRVDDIQRREKGERLVLSDVMIEGVKRETGPQRLSVSLREDAKDLHIGDRVTLKATLFPPPGPAMPGAYDFARSFYFDRIAAVGFSTQMPHVLESTGAHSFEEWLNDFRLSLGARISAPMSKDNGAVAEALTVGEMSGISEEVKEAMRDSGLYHVLSISGLHMALAAGLIYFTVRLLLSLYPPLSLKISAKKIAAVAGLVSAFAYLLLAGYPVPAVRSFVMVACVMVAVLFDRSGISLYSLAWAAFLILLFQPEALLGASFQLSFAATLGILALYERFGHALYKGDSGPVRKLWYYIIGLMSTSLVATLATTPLALYHFNRFTLWGIVANMLIVPLASLWIMPAAVLALLLMPLGLEHWPLVWLEQGIGWMLWLARWFAGMPNATFAVPSLTFAGMLMVIFGGLWLCLWQKKWRLLGIPLILLGMGSIALHRPYDLLINDDGNKIALRLPDNRFVFIRGEPDSFEAKIWLQSHGQETALSLKELGKVDWLSCDKNKCIIDISGQHIVVGKRKGVVVSELCPDKATIVIAEDVLPDTCNANYKIDRRFLGKSGAIGVRFTDKGAKLDTAAKYRGKRPWVPRPYSGLYHSNNPVMMRQ